jgi:hypothetical protein
VTEISDYLKKIGKKGGKTRAQRLSPKEREESARRAAQARWKKSKDKPK